MGQLTESITQEDLEEYFKKFGDIVEVFVPRPFKGIAFVSFTKSDAALTALDQDHIIKDIRLSVSVAMPKDKDQRRGSRNGGGTPYGSRMRGSRDSYNNRDHYYDNGGWDDFDRGGYSDRRYSNSRYDRKSYDNGRSYNSGQVWRKNDYSDSPGSQSKDVSQIDPNLVAAVVEKTMRGVIGNMSKYE